MLGYLKNLQEDMKNKGWTICSFMFQYKKSYVVLVKRFVGDEKRNDKYALVKLEFMEENNLKNSLYVEANSSRLITDAKTLREYFEIQYSDNLGDILKQFTQRLGSFIPSSVNERVSELEREAMVRSLSKSDSEDPSKIYIVGVRRNPKGKTRSEFNADKTKLLYKEVFEKFKNDKSISFCYSNDPNKLKTLDEIITNFAHR